MLAALASAPQDEQAALRLVLSAAADAIGALAELNLCRFEADDEGEQAYEVWSEIAPVVAQTIEPIHHFLETADAALPLQGDGANTSPAVAAVQTRVGPLRQELCLFGEDMRRPALMANRWSLLQYLAAFRGRVRAALGDLIFEAASTLAPVTRAEVVPFYQQDLEQALALRRALLELHQDVATLERKMQHTTDPSERLAFAGLLGSRLGQFAASVFYPVLRVPDRRVLVRIKTLFSGAGLDADAALRYTAELRQFLGSISIDKRDTLQRHDRDLIAAAFAAVDSAVAALQTRHSDAMTEITAALAAVSALEGRGQFDALAAAAKSYDPRAQNPATLLAHMTALKQALQAAATRKQS
jgi:hypothetical protein